MIPSNPETTVSSQRQSQQILEIYHAYRLLIGLALLLLVSSELSGEWLSLGNPTRFQHGVWLYLLINLFFTQAVRTPASNLRLTTLVFVDLSLLLYLLFMAGGTPSGLGSLVVIAVTIANILLPRQNGLLVAAGASLGLLATIGYLSLEQVTVRKQLAQTGALGALCFIGTLVIQALRKRLQVSEKLATQRAEDVATLETLNSLILQRIRLGIILINARAKVVLSNQSALQLLGDGHLLNTQLNSRHPSLYQLLLRWQQNPLRAPDQLDNQSSETPPLQVSFTAVQHGQEWHTLIFLEDLARLNQQAQQIKLASLGRLTASIAHEIRNPLGAISHAVQLLDESEQLAQSDQRLVSIILTQSQRMNLLIENVLQLSRRRQAEPAALNLSEALQEFAEEYRATLLIPPQHIHVECADKVIETCIDISQLSQMLTNLVQNGLRYSGQRHSQAQVWLHLYRHPQTEQAILDILDDGPGVAKESVPQLFEPFYTTDRQGTGLGLYLCREICESNQARIDYLPRDDEGSCFRITFAHPHQSR